jgi:hypothetical protein
MGQVCAEIDFSNFHSVCVEFEVLPGCAIYPIGNCMQCSGELVDRSDLVLGMPT